MRSIEAKDENRNGRKNFNVEKEGLRGGPENGRKNDC